MNRKELIGILMIVFLLISVVVISGFFYFQVSFGKFSGSGKVIFNEKEGLTNLILSLGELIIKGRG